MNKRLLCLLVCVCARTSFALTFEQFKQLGPRQADAIIDDEGDPSRDDVIRWKWRSLMGEDSRRLKERGRLAVQDGYQVVINLLVNYQHLRETYLTTHWVPEDTPLAEIAKARQVLPVAISLLAALAPTPETQRFTAEANLVARTWDKRWPDGTGKPWVVTDVDMAAIEQAKQWIVDELEVLPKVTEEQEQAAIDALPEDGPHGPVPGLFPQHR